MPRIISPTRSHVLASVSRPKKSPIDARPASGELPLADPLAVSCPVLRECL
jgi:hypothetical protein